MMTVGSISSPVRLMFALFFLLQNLCVFCIGFLIFNFLAPFPEHFRREYYKYKFKHNVRHRGAAEGGEGEECPEGRPGHDLHPKGHGDQRVRAKGGQPDAGIQLQVCSFEAAS